MTDKVMLVATCRQQVGHRWVEAGAAFEASPMVAAQLRRDMKATLAPASPSAPRGRYKRRDMRAQG